MEILQPKDSVVLAHAAADQAIPSCAVCVYVGVRV